MLLTSEAVLATAWLCDVVVALVVLALLVRFDLIIILAYAIKVKLFS